MAGETQACATRRNHGGRLGLLVAVVLALTALTFSFGSNAAPVAITVPYSSIPVADVDLDGNPATGAWADALSAVVPLENGEVPPYGSATLYAKHDGTFMYFRIDAQVDVPWTSAAGNHFWLGFQVSPTGTGHHGGGTWDGIFFGLWDGTDYVPQPTPTTLVPVDTTGFGRPPAKDASQDALGRMRYTGAAAPYSFTVEWKKKLNTGDASDIAYAANGVTTYNFFVTTDTDGRGSAGGGIAHDGVTNVNTMRFAPPTNTPPTVDLTSPDGGEVWTGGSVHRIWWNMTDAETAVTSIRVWINYSTNGGTTYGPIPGAQGLTGLSNPANYSWTVPAVNTVQARVNVTVADPQGARAFDVSLANFAIDSTPPTVVGFNPGEGATGVPPTTAVTVTFSEAMTAPSAQQAFSLRRVDTGTYAPGAFAWAGNAMTFTPSAPLAQGIVYRAQVNATARDASDPGNPLGTVRTANFTTADVTPPTITGVTALPSPQESGGPVNISAAVTDNGLVAEVWIEVRDPGGALLGNVTAAYDPGTGRYFRQASYTRPGTYTFRLSARDAAGNWAVATGSFVIVDTRPPTIQHTPVAQALRGVPIRISAIVTDAQGVAGVRVNYTDVLGARFNVTMALNVTAYEADIPGQPQAGTLAYFLWAVDPSANAARTPAYTVAIIGSDTTPPSIANALAMPPVQNASYTVNISATVTDNVGLRAVNVVVADPLGQVLGNFTLARLGATDTFYDERAYGVLGVHAFVVWAVDTSNNNASAQGSFEIVDRMPPVFQWVTVTPPVQEAGLPTNITASVTDNVAVSSVVARIRDAAGNTVLNRAMSTSSGLHWIEVTTPSLGNFTFVLTAQDTVGNVATYAGNFTVVDTQPPVAVAGPDVTVWVGSTVILNGTASHDNLGIVNFTWSFVFNGTNVVLYGPVAGFVFDVVGRFNVTLNVVDVAGLEGTAGKRVTVITDTTPPPAPKNPLAIPIAVACLQVTWEPSTASDVAGYRIYRWNQTRASFDLIAEVPANATSYTDCGLLDDTVYSYWIIAFDGTGNASPPSPIANGRTLHVGNVSSLDWLYQVVIVILLVLNALFVALWLNERKREAPPQSPQPPRK